MFKRMILAMVLVIATAASAGAADVAGPFPTPQLKHSRNQIFGPDVTLLLQVLNWDSYPSELFSDWGTVPRPQCKPKSGSFMSSRTWVEVYSWPDKVLVNRFCSFMKNRDLQRFGFVTKIATMPRQVYIVITDHIAKRSTESNVVDIP